MDPVLRLISDARRLRSEVENPFDRDAVIEYFCELADEMGFTPAKHVRRNGASVDCAWKDGNDVFLAMNVEFGSEREILGAAAQAVASGAEVGVLVTASNPLKPMNNVETAIRALKRGVFVIIDVRDGKGWVIR